MTKSENLIQNLEKANISLKKAIQSPVTRMNKDATIHRFEFTFELSWKIIQSCLRDEGLDCKSPKGCLREAARVGWIDALETWFDFLSRRNLIAHTYDEQSADIIYQKAITFPREVDNLLVHLKRLSLDKN